jgi:hypothetical protein
MRRLIALRQTPDYSADWAAFNYLYFGANCVKAHLVARTLNQSGVVQPISVIDLGCGGGASTVGFALGLANAPGLDRSIDEILCVDRSPEQLSLLRRCVLAPLSRMLGDTHLSVVRQDVFEFLSSERFRNAVSRNGTVIVIASYISSEMDDGENARFRKLLRATLNPGKDLLQIIESRRPETGLEIEDLSGRTRVVPYDSICVEQSALRELAPTILPKFDSRLGKSVLTRYKLAWELHDFRRLRRLFTDDARYKIHAKKTLVGFDQILQYWKKNASQQRDVLFTVIDSRTTGDTIEAVWQAEFRRIDTDDRRILNGSMQLRMRGDKVFDFSEIYEQKRSPLR